jgi:pyruvate/2-oxoglutarate dehydrogenase complex dihydrolipoamide dehydrogenase (E3) component
MSPGAAMFTYVATYQGRIVADNILGRHHCASYEGIPRVVFADPEIAAVGMTAAHAVARGIAAATAEIRVANSVDLRARPARRRRRPRRPYSRGAGRRVGGRPLASEWIRYAALAIRAHIPISVLLDQVAQYPAYTEAWLAALEQLSL